MATATPDVDEIRRRMAQIRHELHEDVKEVVEGAEEVTDWRRYIRMYPLAAVGVAFAVGYFIVPRRRKEEPREVVRITGPEGTREVVGAERGEKQRRKSLISAVFGMAAPLAWRAVQNYAMGYLEQWIAQKQQEYLTTFGPIPDQPGQSTGQPGRKPPEGPQKPSGPEGAGGSGRAGGMKG